MAQSGREPPTVGPPLDEGELLNRVVDGVERRLPPAWSVDANLNVLVGGRNEIDAVIDVVGPEGVKATFVVEAKGALVTRDLPRILEQLEACQGYVPGGRPMVAARYLPESARRWLEERGVAYADATGHLWLTTDRPGLFLRDVGADRDPWRGPGRPRGTLRGAPAARVVRALVDYAEPAGVPELIRRSGASTGATYRVVEFLAEESLIERQPEGVVTVPSWRRLLERWSQDYGFQSSNPVRACLQPRGLPALQEKLAREDARSYAVTGSLAASNWAPYASPRLAMIYVHDPTSMVDRLDLRPVDSGANVLVAKAKYDVVFDRASTIGGLCFVAPSQAAVDLLGGPGRNPAEGQELLDWMEKHEDRWRR